MALSTMIRLFTTSILAILALSVSGTSFSQYAGPKDDPIVIQIIELDHAAAEDLAGVLQPFLSKDGRITAYPPGNILIIKDRKSIVAQLVKVIKGRLANGD
jgi:type II secretory pathway component GspD/PulD (secretin)